MLRRTAAQFSKCERRRNSVECERRRNLSKREPLADFRDDLLWGLRRIDGDGIVGFLEVGKLAGEDLLAGVVAFSRAQALAKQFVGTLQVDQRYIGIDLKQVAVAALEGGACQNHVEVLRFPLEHRFAQGMEPRDAVFVGERNAARHFLNVGWRMEIVRVSKLPLELRGEAFADGRFSGSGWAHQKNDQVRSSELKVKSSKLNVKDYF